ncbi:hypothetical protein DPSP01_007911 [Paraphaeosphaeria sporulosa]
MMLPSLLALPPTILLLCATSATAEPQWPHNLPKHMKYFPEDEVHVKRSLDIQEKIRREKPIGVKKMSSDAGEMFMFDNWIFASDIENNEAAERSNTNRRELANITGQFEAALRPVEEGLHLDSYLRFRARDMLLKRGFKCPTGTNDCSSIGQANSCCSTGSTCIKISDQGFGPVGCCPSGESCSGGISCNTGEGYTSCPESPNGGCCLPGYSCSGVGCVAVETSVTYVQPSSTSATSAASSTGVIVIPTTQSSSASSSPSPTPTPSTSSTCSTGWFSCPASVGGGCCQNGRTCAAGASCLGDDTSSTMAPSAPVRPTSDSGSTSAPPASSSPNDSVCPTGFYVCSAYYPSGCCRVGSDCQTTGACMPTASTTVVNTNGVVIVAPSGASVASQGGSCPSAWYSCAASLGGNCCPNGYSCGDQCTATAGSSVADKMAPSAAATIPSVISIWAIITGAVGVGFAMIML